MDIFLPVVKRKGNVSYLCCASYVPGVAPVSSSTVGCSHKVDVSAEVEGSGLADYPICPLSQPLVARHVVTEPTKQKDNVTFTKPLLFQSHSQAHRQRQFHI